MPSETPTPPPPSISIEDYQKLFGRKLQLTLVGGAEGADKTITSPRIQKLGLALAGYLDYIHEGRVQFMGLSEVTYLNMLSSQRRTEAIDGIFSRHLTCIVITQSLESPTELQRMCDLHKVPLFHTDTPSSTAISETTNFLEEQLAPTTTVHGVLMEVFGLGVLLLGPSGIGKSECALDLIMRSHRLVSDDVIVIKRFGMNSLLGSGPADFQFHMELRGLGIISIKDLFGISSLSNSKTIDLAIDLVRWKAEQEYDRLGLEEKWYTLLEVAVPLFTMPVAPGRNLATLVEVAVRIQMLRGQGYSPSGDLFRKLENRLKVPQAAD